MRGRNAKAEILDVIDLDYLDDLLQQEVIVR